MKLAFQGTVNYGGQGTFLIELTKNLADMVECIHIFPTTKSVKGKRILDLYGKIPPNVKLNERVNLIKEIIRDTSSFKNFDIIHVNYATYGLLGVIAKKLYDVGVVYTTHFPHSLSGKLTTRILYKIELEAFLPFVARNVDTIVTVSYYNKNILKKKYGIKAEVVYHGIDTTRFNYDRNVCRDYLRKSLRLAKEDIILLFVGRFHGFKDIPTAIRALPKVIRTHRNVKFLIIGSGEAYPQIKREIQKNNVEKHVILLGDIPSKDLPKYYIGADIFVFPSLGESFGLVFLEAMASGLPIIAANAGASPEVVGDAGLLFEPKNSEDLADKIIELISDRELYGKLKENCLERVKQFTWRKAAEQYYRIYRKVLKKR